jgi:hypothetical protein
LKPILRRLAADLLTSSPARFAALAVDVMVLAAAHLATRLSGRVARTRLSGRHLER